MLNAWFLPVIFIKEPVALYAQPGHHAQAENQPCYSLVHVLGFVDSVESRKTCL